MQQFLNVLSALDTRRKVIVGLATVAMFAAVLGLSRMATQPNMALLYVGLDPSAAGEVIKALEARGATYDVRGGAIFVDSAQRDELRLTLASEGLPANSTQGYEILDNLSGFGTTSQMFNAAYWRAKEGELARTIMANPLIRAARVHLGNPAPQGLRQRNAPTASVTVTTQGGTLPPNQARALKYLVAAAVSGLTPENVAVIDSAGGLIAAAGEGMAGSMDPDDRAEVLRRNVERLLEARVGPGNAVVEVSLETVSEREAITERRIDPDSRTAISSETVETSNSSTNSAGAGVTVASNLPTGAAGAGGGSSNSSDSETRQRVNYEVSETTREVIRMPGAIRRLTVAVLVDGIESTDADGNTVWTPRSEEEMASLRELVASAVGFDESRGDVITLKSLQFEPVPAGTAPPEPGLLSNVSLDMMSLLQLAVLAIVSLVLGLFVLRPILASRAPAEQPAAPALPPGEAAPGSLGVGDSLAAGATGDMPGDLGADSGLPALTGEIEDGSGFPAMATMTDFDFGDDGGDGLPALNDQPEDPVERLRALIAERQSETVEILRGWMENEEETA